MCYLTLRVVSPPRPLLAVASPTPSSPFFSCAGKRAACPAVARARRALTLTYRAAPVLPLASRQERLVIYTTCPPEAGAPKGKCEGYNDQNLLNEMIEGRPLGAAVWHDGAKNQQHNVRRKEECASVFKGGAYGIPLEEVLAFVIIVFIIIIIIE
jgi:hypothetical protein